MGSCYPGDHTAGDHIHMDIIICNIEEPQQKYHLEMVSNRLLGGWGGLKQWFNTIVQHEDFLTHR